MAEEKSIRIFHTHVEVSPYKQGENEKLERMFSVWIDAEYRYEPIGYYIQNNKLYLPRGVSPYLLEKEFDSTPYVVHQNDKPKKFRNMKLISKPKNRIQEEATEFLTCEGRFKNALSYSQQALLLDTGDGKTYSAINAIMYYGVKAIIITHQDKIKQQWIDEFLKHTNVPKEELIDIKGAPALDKIMRGKRYVNGSFYFVNHQTLQSYAKSRGWNQIREFFKMMGFGIKIFDEAHLAFRNVLMVDFFSNTKKTFYLTANFGRSDSQEERLFKKCFSSAYQFGEETKNYEEKRKHIIYVPVLYHSSPDFNQLAMAQNAYGFSVLGFSKYALHEDEKKTQIRVFRKVLQSALKLDGKILVTVPKIDDTRYLQEIIQDEVGCGKTIMTINSNNNKDSNNQAKIEADIICTTIKSCGTGVDIKGLRSIINLEPFSSNITTNQLSGRLREYTKDKDTYFFDLIDLSFPVCERQLNTKLRYLKKKCKAIKKWLMDI